MTADNLMVPHVGVALFSRDGRLLLHTPRFAELLATAAPRATGGVVRSGAWLSDILTRLGAVDAADALALAAIPVALHVVSPAGRAVDITFERLPYGRCCLTVTDVTEARAAQEELRRAHSLAEAASRAKSTFLATMSHELRTPLNAVIGFSEALRHEDGVPVDPGRVAEFATAIHQAGQHLLERINTVIDVARIESGKFELVSDLIDLAYMLPTCVRQMQPAADKARLTITVVLSNGLPGLRGDERRLRQALFHLLSNAVKFTPANGEVIVTAAIAADGDLSIAVRDTGIGIAADDIQRVFEPFNPLETGLARRRTGAGLGLYAARSLVAAHGGTLTLVSAPGRGTTATMQLPRGRLEPIPSSLELTQDKP